MSTVQKIFVVVVFALSLAFTVMTLQMLAIEQTWKEKHNEVKAELSDKVDGLEKDKTELEGTVQNLNTEVTEKSATVKSLTEEKNEVTAINSQLRLNLGQAEQTAKSLSEYNKVLQTQNEDYKSKLDETNQDYLREKKRAEDLVKIYQFKQDELADVIAELNDLKGTFKSLQANYKQAEEENQSYRIVLETVKTQYDIDVVKLMTDAPLSQDPIDGKVVAVAKDKETDSIQLVMLSVGRDEGVKRGQQFVIFRDDVYIGKVVVDKVFDDMATASVIKESMARDKNDAPLEIKQYDSASTRVY